MKLLIGILLAAIAGIVLFLSIFLSPNDMRKCATTPNDTAGCQPADAVIVVSGGDTASRTSRGVELYHAGWAPLIIFSGAARDTSGPSNAAVMREQAISQGVPGHAILTEEYSRTTAENAEQSNALFRQRGIERVVLVTSAYHQRRAAYEFIHRTQNVSIVNAPLAADNQWSPYWWLTPQGWYLAISELVKVIIIYAGGGNTRW